MQLGQQLRACREAAPSRSAPPPPAARARRSSRCIRASAEPPAEPNKWPLRPLETVYLGWLVFATVHYASRQTGSLPPPHVTRSQVTERLRELADLAQLSAEMVAPASSRAAGPERLAAERQLAAAERRLKRANEEVLRLEQSSRAREALLQQRLAEAQAMDAVVAAQRERALENAAAGRALREQAQLREAAARAEKAALRADARAEKERAQRERMEARALEKAEAQAQRAAAKLSPAEPGVVKVQVEQHISPLAVTLPAAAPPLTLAVLIGLVGGGLALAEGVSRLRAWRQERARIAAEESEEAAAKEKKNRERWRALVFPEEAAARPKRSSVGEGGGGGGAGGRAEEVQAWIGAWRGKGGAVDEDVTLSVVDEVGTDEDWWAEEGDDAKGEDSGSWAVSDPAVAEEMRRFLRDSRVAKPRADEDE